MRTETRWPSTPGRRRDLGWAAGPGRCQHAFGHVSARLHRASGLPAQASLPSAVISLPIYSVTRAVAPRRSPAVGRRMELRAGRTLARMLLSRTRASRYDRRRRRRMARVEHELSDEQWTALKEAWGGCAYCGATGVPLQRDCIQPIALGGRYTLDNVAPACGSCNAQQVEPGGHELAATPTARRAGLSAAPIGDHGGARVHGRARRMMRR